VEVYDITSFPSSKMRVPVTYLHRQKLESLDYRLVKTEGVFLVEFIPQCDRQTDGRTDRRLDRAISIIALISS